MSIPWGVSLVHCFQVEFKVGNVGFCEWRKTGEKSSEPTREPTTNSTLMWRHVRASNLGHSGGRQVRSPLRHPRYSYLKKNNVHRLQRSMQPKQTIWIIEFMSPREKCSLSETLTLKQNSSTYTEEILVLAAGWSVSLWWELLRRFRRFCGGSQGAGIFSISLYLLYCLFFFFFPFIFVFFLFFRILLMFLFYFCQCSFCGYCLL